MFFGKSVFGKREANSLDRSVCGTSGESFISQAAAGLFVHGLLAAGWVSTDYAQPLFPLSLSVGVKIMNNEPAVSSLLGSCNGSELVVPTELRRRVHCR